MPSFREQDDAIAEVKVIFEGSNGEMAPGRIFLGRPYQKGPGQWACPVGIEGLHDKLPDTAGGDSFHALCLAHWLIKNRLETFLANGGKIFRLNDSGLSAFKLLFPFQAYFNPDQA